MGLQSAMTTALTGMQGAETIIDVVGNNVANSGTTGFKESDVLFATQFLQTQSIGSAPSGLRGGTNPRQIGLGVKVAAINPNFTQGTIEISANPLDVAIQGDGFLVVQGPQGELYTRNGQIQTNSANELVTVTGNRLLGYGVDENFNVIRTEQLVPLTIPLGGAPVSQVTQNAFFEGVLSSGVDDVIQAAITSSEILGDANYDFPNDPGFNSGDAQQVIGPDVTVTSGLASPTAPGGGPGVATAGNYQYRITWYTDDGLGNLLESSPSGIISIPGVAAGDDIDFLSNLPIDGSPSSIWAGRRIYRSVDGSDFQLIDTIPNVTDATWTDDGSGTLGVELNDETLLQGNYSYYVTFVNGSQESRPSTRIGPITSGVDGRIRLDNLPQPDGGIGQIRIYRNLATDSSDFRLVSTLPAGTTTFIDDAQDSELTTPIDLMGVRATNGTLLTNVVVREGDTYTTPFVEGNLSFAGKRGVSTLETREMTITATSTVQDLIDFMRKSFGIINSDPDDPGDALLSAAGGQINDGVISFTSNAGEENALSVPLSSLEITPNGSTTPQPISMAFSETREALGQGSTTDFIAYDSLGTPINVRITTVLESKSDTETVFRWFATSSDNESIDGGTDVGTGLIRFNSSGQISSDPIVPISIDRTLSASESPLTLNLDFTRLSGLDRRDGNNDPVTSMAMTRQDGFPPGTLSSFTITESGTIRGIFSNGAERSLGQIAMAKFANNTGLQQVGENMFAQGVNSGEAVIDTPGEAGIGTLTAGALELSNTDIGQNLIELILASTQYRGGARVITTAQQLLDELLSLRR